MKYIFKIFFLISILNIQNIVAQEYKENFSNGTLNINGKELPIKIFSTSSGQTLDAFADEPIKDNILVFLNQDMNENFSPIFTKYQEIGYQFLDKNFQPTQVIKDFQYLYKPLDHKNLINESTKVTLHTKFMIWNPTKGINLGFFTLHFYSLMFVIAFGLGFIVMKKIYKIDNIDEKYLEPLLTWTILGTIFGARIGHILFYQPELFKQDFWAVFLPIRTKPHLEFTGFSGLASHGATIALIGTTLYYSLKILKKNPLWVYDRIGIVVALGGGFVRIGNFFNSEIIGKISGENSFFAMLFPQMSDEYGITVPRYPSQLFEAVGYFLLFGLLWFLYNFTNKKYQQGWLFGLFFTVLWSIRFFVEFLKESQGDEFISFAGLNTGQILSIPFIIAGIVLMVISKKFVIKQ